MPRNVKGGIRNIFKRRAEAAGLLYYSPHKFRHTATVEAFKHCRTAEELRAISQNLGHENIGTTFSTYGKLPDYDVENIIARINFKKNADDAEAMALDDVLKEKLLEAFHRRITMNEPEVHETEADVETDGTLVVTEPPQSVEAMRSIIEIGKIIEPYAAMIQKIVSTAVKLTYDGDWTIHKKDGAADEDQKANMGAAAAERIANFIGISESSWTEGRKDWSDDRKHYTWTYEADFSLGKRKIHVMSRVGTRDKFFGKAGGQWIPLEDVQEDNILKAAFRACRKEGVRTLLGLRNVPVSKLKEFGFNVAKINNVGFEEKGKQIAKADIKTNEKGLVEKTIQVVKLEKFEGTAKSTGKLWVRFDVTDKEGIKYACFAAGDSRRIQVLAERQEDQKPVKIMFKIVPYNNRENYQIEHVEGADA